MQKTITFTLNSEKSEKVFSYLKNVGNLIENTNEYVKWSFKGDGWAALMYTSGKFVVQTFDDVIILEIKKIIGESTDFQPHIGSDEVGKGDYFGPMVVCCCYVNGKVLEKIRGYKITDSKKLSDDKIIELGDILRKILDYEVKVISPEKYVQLHEKYRNVGIILAKAHVEVIEKLYSRIQKNVEYVVVDQFSKSKKRLDDEFKLSVALKQYHHAESNIAVAAASILARYYFLLEMKEMNRGYNMQFPLGATHVIGFGKTFVEKYGSEELKKVAKISFRTTKQIIA